MTQQEMLQEWVADSRADLRITGSIGKNLEVFA